MTARPPAQRRRLLLLVAVVVAAAAFVVDARLTEGALPELPDSCEPALDPVCNEERNALLGEWRGDVFDLEAGLEVRYWVYAALFTLAALGIAALGPRGESETWRTTADDLGVLGVAWLAVGIVVLVAADASYVDVPAAPVLLPAAAFVAAAALGRIATLRSGAEPRPETGPLGPSVPIAGLVLVGVAVLLAAVVLLSQSGQAECGTDDATWVDVTRDASAAAGAVAGLLGLIALFGRRWMPALVCVTIGPIAGIVALVAGICLD